LFLDQAQSEINRVLESVSLDVLQFHGSETQQQCSLYNLPWLKAVAMEDDQSARRAEKDFPAAMGLLLDSHSRGQRGGSGKVFDWSLAKPLSMPVWLAGGLNVENVGQAIRAVRPYAVDVSSGVESAPGIKDTFLINDFIRAVKAI
jgi:phosphoribosylanthranilate isomerase